MRPGPAPFSGHHPCVLARVWRRLSRRRPLPAPSTAGPPSDPTSVLPPSTAGPLRRLAPTPPPHSAARKVAAAWAGPVLIVACVVAVLHAFVWGGQVTIQHIDVLPQW